MYNKTALYRMKKDDLMQLFLDQQAEKNQLVLESEENQKLKEENEKLKAHMIYMGQNKMKADMKKLKQENEKLKKRIDEHYAGVPSFRVQDMYRDVKEKNEKLNQLNDYAYNQINELKSKFTLLTDEIEKFKLENKKPYETL